MAVKPTTGAEEHSVARAGWSDRPWVARSIRILLFVIPIMFGWLAVKMTAGVFWRPEGFIGTVAWVVQAIAIASASTLVLARLAERLTPLTTLFRMTLVFPDEAPSRFGVALRSGTLAKITPGDLHLGDNRNDAAIRAIELVSSLTTHDRRTRGHTERVRAYAEMIAVEMGMEGDELNKLRWGVLLHDIGKLSVPEPILNKRGKPTAEEWAVLKEHPAAGAAILEPLADWLGDHGRAAAEHHERWDGNGYPNRLRGEEISLAGRICAVADAFDVITSKRSYKEPMAVEAARKELVECSGAQFDPVVVRSFLRTGLRTPPLFGGIGGVVEASPVLRAVANATSSSVTGAVAAAAISTVAFVGGGTAPSPEALAFEPDPVVEVVVPAESPTSTASAAPATTTAPTTTAPTTTTSEAQQTTTTTTQAPTTTSTTTTSLPPKTTTTLPPTTTQRVTTTTRPPTTTTRAPTTTTTQPPRAPQPRGNRITIVNPNDVPSPLTTGRLSSPTNAFVWTERNPIVTTDEIIAIKTKQNETMTPERMWKVIIPAGTRVCVYFVHIDTSQPNGDLSVTVNFRAPVLGVTGWIKDLEETNAYAFPGINYMYDGLADPDTFMMSGNKLTINSQYVDGNRDQTRVFTAC